MGVQDSGRRALPTRTTSPSSARAPSWSSTPQLRVTGW